MAGVGRLVTDDRPTLCDPEFRRLVRRGGSMIDRSSLVQLRLASWPDAVGIVLKVEDQNVTVRLGNGTVLVCPIDDLAAVEYMPGTGLPARFPEEFGGPARPGKDRDAY